MRGFATTVLSATLASSLAWSAQTSTDNEIVAIGCIARAVTDGSLAGSPGVPPASPNTAPTLANSPEPTGVYLLNNAATPSETRGSAGDVTASQPRSFQLDGTNAEFDRHVGHQVEIAGTVHTESVGASPGPKTPVQHIQVKSLRMVAAKCPEQAVTPK